MAAPYDPATPRIGDFRLLGEIGRGGMGIVHRAVHEPSGRACALKVLPSLVGLDPAAVARFHREAEAAARISHPGIVAVHSFGEQDGVHWLAMDYVGGPSLDRLLGDLAGRDPAAFRGTFFEETGLCDVLPGLDRSGVRAGGAERYVRSCLWMLAGAAEALVVAHRAGVVHRDIKPSNLLVGRGGRLVIADFGLARNLGDEPLTRTGDVVGTPCYMAPEQARGDRDVGPAADVYGLGATLFELLTLSPPFEGAHPGDILRRILDEEPLPLRLLQPAVPRPVAELVERCLEKDPSDRPADAAELAQALRTLAEGGVWTAPRRSWRRRLSRAARRHARPLAASAVLLTAVVGSLAVAGVVRMRDAEQAGREALLGARTHLARAEFSAAEKAYGRAEALLGVEVVVAARTFDREALFDDLYSQGHHDGLAAWLQSWPPSSRDAAHRQRLARARGLGTVECVVPGSWPEGTVRIVASREPAEAVGAATAGVAVEVDPGMPAVLDMGRWRLSAEGHGPGALARQSLDVDVVRDSRTRLEFLPVREADRPAPGAILRLDPLRGVPVWLDPDPASGDDLRRLGATIEDPELRAELLAAAARDPGALPRATGRSLHLEDPQARLFAMLSGAHLAAPELRSAVSDREPRSAAGAGPSPVWLARFAEPQVAVEPLRLFDTRAAAVAATGDRRARRFAIDAAGRVALTLWARCDEQGRLRFDLAGWRRRDVPRVVGLDGGRQIGAQVVDLPDGAVELRLARPGVTVRVDVALAAVEALQGAVGRLELDFPAGVSGAAELFAVQLPPGVAVREAGALACAARQPGGGSRWEAHREPDLAPAPRLVLDLDGAWTDRWPSAGRLAAWLRAAGEPPGSFAGEPRAVAALGDVVVIDLEGPRRIAGAGDAGLPVPGWRERYCVDRAVDPPAVLAHFPARGPDTGVLEAQVYRHAALGVTWRPVAAPAEADADAVPAAGFVLERLAVHWLPLQVRARHAAVSGVQVVVTALPVESGREPAAALFLLSGGASESARRLRDAFEEPVPFARGIVLVDSHALLFTEEDGAVRYERWLHLRKAGQAELLWREVVRAEGGQDAVELAESDALRGWFERLRVGLAY